MAVLGKHCFVFDSVNGRTCDVAPYDPSIGTVKKVPVVDAALVYDCPYTFKPYLLIVRNALYVPTMENNLIPPFLIREAGIKLQDVPKIHVKEPNENDHAITFEDENLRIPLQLNGIFSYFHTRTPTHEEIAHCDPIFLTPDSDNWDPHSEHFAQNEESMLDWEGNMAHKRNRKEHILDLNVAVDVPTWTNAIDNTIMAAFNAMEIDNGSVPAHADDANRFASAINQRAVSSKFAISIGSVSSYRNETSDLFDLGLSRTDLYESEVHSMQASKSSKVTPELLSKIWHIKPDLAKKTLSQTTQLYRQGADNDLSRQLSTNDRMIRYKRINSKFFTDTLFVTKKGKSSRGNTCAQLFVSDKGYVAIYPMKRKGDYVNALHLFCKEIGVPMTLLVDPSGEQTSKEARKFCNQVGTTLRILEESTQWANRAELYIGLFKESIRKDLHRTNSPMTLWDFCAERRARIHNVIPRDLFQLNGNNPTTATFGVEADISNICQFDWYEWCYFREEGTNLFPFQKKHLGRVLGPIKNEGNEMAQAVLTISGRVVPRRSIRPLTIAEINSESEKNKRRTFDDAILKKFGNSMTVPDKDNLIDLDLNDLTLEPDEIKEQSMHDQLVGEDPLDHDGTSVFDKPINDYLIHAEVLLPKDESMTNAKVKGRSKGINGEQVGTYDPNPLLNSIVYDVEFPDGEIKQYSANIIAENMYSQVDSEGHSRSLMDSIVDYKKDGNAIPMENKYILTKSGQRRMRMTTVGWKLLVRFRDGSEQWIPLKILKETNPVEVAEFAFARGIDDQPAFAWWVPYTLRERDRIIAGINARVKKTTHKYGIEVPTTIEDARKLDKANNNTYWEDAIQLEMANVKVAFEILDESQSIPIGWRKSSGHLVFDVKMDFTRKARWVKDGHKTPQPDNSTYAGVVSRESVRIALTYAALNGIDVVAADIKNAYLQAPSSEQHYIVCGAEFGLENIGKIALIRRALYGGKVSGADFWRHLRTCMSHLGFISCQADPDIWMREAQKDDGSEFWEYVLLYVDDALCISMNAERVIRQEIGKYFFIKPKSVGPPKLYLGNKVSKLILDNGAEAWSFSSSQYVLNAVGNVEKYLASKGKSLPKKAKAPLTTNYRPEIDTSRELEPIEASYYQSLIGILRWIVELGRVDITVEASMMASCMALPREGHLQQLYHIFAYLKAKHNTEMVFDPTEPSIDESLFIREDWKHTTYGSCIEQRPANMPQPRGFGFKIRAYVDSDHAADNITRRSRTGFLIYLNSAPVYWTSKKQGSIETSSFGSEFIALKNCCEYLRGLRYKLRMMGIPCEYPSYIYGDNKSVLINSSNPFSMLKKKSSSIAYHFVRENVAKDECRVAYINTHDNVADMLTKPLAGGEKRLKFINMILHHIT